MMSTSGSKIRIPIDCPTCNRTQDVLVGSNLFLATIQVAIALEPLEVAERRAILLAAELGMCKESAAD